MNHPPNLPVAGTAVPRAVPVPPTLPAIGPWQLVRVLGEGRYARVHQARPTASPPERPADYAVKVLKPEYEADPEAIELIRREAYVGRRVSHPHVVSILSSGVSRPPYFVVMPHLEGMTLAALLQGEKSLTVAPALWIARQVSEALDALHTEGFLHADIKPGNIFVMPRGHTMLLDLGFARSMRQPGSVIDRPLMATFSYAAPELFTSAVRADARSDVYSLGVTLFEMLTGRLPFDETDPAQLATAHLEQSPPNVRRLAPHVSSDVARLVGQMLAKEPLRRPQTAAEAVASLVRLEVETFADRDAV